MAKQRCSDLGTSSPLMVKHSSKPSSNERCSNIRVGKIPNVCDSYCTGPKKRER